MRVALLPLDSFARSQRTHTHRRSPAIALDIHTHAGAVTSRELARRISEALVVGRFSSSLSHSGLVGSARRFPECYNGRHVQLLIKELLYWLAVWSVALCAIVTFIPELAGRILLAVWFIGTTVLNKAFGDRAGFGYACFVGIVLCLLPVVTAPSRPRFEFLTISFFLLFGLVPGSAVWFVAFCFDKLHTVLFSRSR